MEKAGIERRARRWGGGGGLCRELSCRGREGHSRGSGGLLLLPPRFLTFPTATPRWEKPQPCPVPQSQLHPASPG